MSPSCCQILSKPAGISCRTTSSFSKMAHLLTQQLLPKNGSRRNALVSLEKTNDHWIRQISIYWIIMAADTYHWNVWTVDEKVMQNLICYFWIFRTRLHVHLKKWTLKFKLLYLLNWTISVILIKFAGYVAWILICKRCKLSEKICYISRDIEFFLGAYFLARPVVQGNTPKFGWNRDGVALPGADWAAWPHG